MSPDHLSTTFAALADPTRRAILARLASGDASVNELAEPFAMSQPAISKHLKVLERAGLISRGRDAQRRPCRLEAQPLAEANEWLERYRECWEFSFQKLDDLLEDLTVAKKNQETNQDANQRETLNPNHKETNMRYPDSFKVSTPSDREIQVTRDFHAPRQTVFDAFTKPELVGAGCWARRAGRCQFANRFEGWWRLSLCLAQGWGKGYGDGRNFSSNRVPEKLVATEKFDESWYPGDALIQQCSPRMAKSQSDDAVLYVSQKLATQPAGQAWNSNGGRLQPARGTIGSDASGRREMIAGTPAQIMPPQTMPSQLRRTSMIDTPQITQTTAQLLALIHVTIPRSEVQSVMGPGLQELMAAVKAQGISRRALVHASSEDGPGGFDSRSVCRSPPRCQLWDAYGPATCSSSRLREPSTAARTRAWGGVG
jgi:DNA-binding transcriptional ArsR family regulator/uncharacterized protein YndB with AHSA1/START domain